MMGFLIALIGLGIFIYLINDLNPKDIAKIIGILALPILLPFAIILFIESLLRRKK